MINTTSLKTSISLTTRKNLNNKNNKKVTYLVTFLFIVKKKTIKMKVLKKNKFSS